MANDRIIRLTIVGDAKSGQKALKDIGDGATQAEIKVENFGKAFLKLGAAIGGAALLKEGADLVGDYSKKVQEAETSIYALTKSQAAVAQAQALANREMQAGRAAYSDTLAAVDQLTPVANRTGQSVEDLYKRTQLLSTLNSGPGGGVEGSIVAISEALSGDWTSAIERFNLPRQLINQLKAEGVPALEILDRALAQSGVTMDTVTLKSKSAANHQKILTDSIAKLGAEAGGQQGIDIWTTALIGLNKVAQSGAVREFAENLNYLLSVAVSAEGFSQISIDVRKSIYLILYAFNDLLEGISAGKLSLKAPLANMRAEIEADEGNLRRTIQERVGKPIKEELDNATKPQPAQTAKIAGYGREMLRALVKGLTEEQLDASAKISGIFADLFNGTDGKADPDKVAAGQAAIALALRDIARDGTIASDTMMDLSSAFGMQTPEVQQLIDAYARLNRAQEGIVAANTRIAGANLALSVVNTQAAGETAKLEAALTSAQQAAERHAQEAADALEPLQNALSGMRAAAEEAGRANTAAIAGLQNELEGLQNQANANAADFQQQIATAQSAYEQAQTRREQLQGAMNAALRGEVEEWLRINEITDASTRKIAEKWQAEIDGQRRAKDGADAEVNKLNRAANRDERDSLLKIAELRKNNKMAEARAEERALEKRRQQRAGELEIARAQAAVAGDEYDEKAEALEKEGKKVDEVASKEEREAKKRVDEVTTQAAAQKTADDAAIKAKQDQIRAVQDAGRAEQERYAAQQRGIQAEIDKVNEAAKVQAAKDKKTIDDAQTILADRKAFWDQEIAKAGENLTQRQNEATAAKNIADDSKTSYEWLERITKLDFQNVLDAAKAAKDLANQPPPPAPTQSSTPLAPAPQNTPGQTETQIGPPGAAPGAQGPANLPPLLEGAPGATPPPGYHSEVDNAGFFWFVPNGYSLLHYGKQQGPGANSGNSGDSTSMSAAGVGGPSFLRTAGIGGGVGAQSGTATDPNGAIIIHNHFPNVRSIEDASAVDKLVQAMRRSVSDVQRAGLDPGKVDQG